MKKYTVLHPFLGWAVGKGDFTSSGHGASGSKDTTMAAICMVVQEIVNAFGGSWSEQEISAVMFESLKLCVTCLEHIYNHPIHSLPSTLSNPSRLRD